MRNMVTFFNVFKGLLVRRVVLNRKFQKQAGFTLIEILIVVILLGILASVIIPQVSISSEDTKLNTLKANLTILRGAVELYRNQHNGTYPGVNDNKGVFAGNVTQSVKGFKDQLTLYTDLSGDAVKDKDATHKFGPYVKSEVLPTNPYNGKNDVTCDLTTTDVTARASDGTTGWKFYPKTGVLVANDGSHGNL